MNASEEVEEHDDKFPVGGGRGVHYATPEGGREAERTTVST